MIADAATAVQAAVYAALIADPPIGAEVHDKVPENATFPQIEIQGGQSIDWSWALIRGEQVTVEIHVWSRQNGYLEARQLMAAVKQRLDRADVPISGVTLVDMQFQDQDTMLDADNITRHGIVRFQATVTVP